MDVGRPEELIAAARARRAARCRRRRQGGVEVDEPPPPGRPGTDGSPVTGIVGRWTGGTDTWIGPTVTPPPGTSIEMPHLVLLVALTAPSQSSSPPTGRCTMPRFSGILSAPTDTEFADHAMECVPPGTFFHTRVLPLAM